MLETKTINYIVVDKKHNYEEEVEHLKQVFGESSCSVSSSSVTCSVADFQCDASSGGRVSCNDHFAGQGCGVFVDGRVGCV